MPDGEPAGNCWMCDLKSWLTPSTVQIWHCPLPQSQYYPSTAQSRYYPYPQSQYFSSLSLPSPSTAQYFSVLKLPSSSTQVSQSQYCSNLVLLCTNWASAWSHCNYSCPACSPCTALPVKVHFKDKSPSPRNSNGCWFCNGFFICVCTDREYQEIHPNNAMNIYSVELNSSLIMMRKCTVLAQLCLWFILYQSMPSLPQYIL